MDLPPEIPDDFPLSSGRYEVKPGLFRFGRSLGGGQADEHVFQFDTAFPRYRAGKLAARAERRDKYFRTHQLDPHIEQAISRFIVDRLCVEHPTLFGFSDNVLTCRLTNERLHAPTFEDLAMQVQEDLAIVRVADSRDWLAAIHLSFPNFWAAEDKIGKTFPAIHEPVAGMEQMNRQGPDLMRVMLEAADGLVRFAWGITWDDQLNRHPETSSQSGRFDPASPAAFLRVERQTIWGFPELGAALFTIRTYFYDCERIRRNAGRREQLTSALQSMSSSSLSYKRLADSRDAFLGWLGSTAD